MPVYAVPLQPQTRGAEPRQQELLEEQLLGHGHGAAPGVVLPVARHNEVAHHEVNCEGKGLSPAIIR
jgi:hypothetical protein